MPKPQRKFLDYLTRENLRMTPQRSVIMQAFLASKGHLSSEELYEVVKRKDPSIGQATVYRTLKLLADSGLAEAVDFADGVVRYEPSSHGEHHDHLICTRCQQFIEIVDPVIERRQEELAQTHGFILESHRMNLYGLCPDCQKKKD